MARILAVVNQKGGVGKTTTAVNLSASLVATKHKVLLVDLDPQGHATMGSNTAKHQLESSVYDLLTGHCGIDSVLRKIDPHGYDLLPGNGDLTAAEVELLQGSRKEFRLKDSLSSLQDGYDFILIDCPPSLNMLTVNALSVADGVIIPLQCEYYALEGLSALLSTIEQMAQVNPKLKIEGLLRTMYDPRNSLTNQVSEQLQQHFGDKLYNTVIPRNVRLAEAPSHGLPVLLYDKNSRGAIAYLSLAGEIIRRQQEKLSTAKLTEAK